MKIKYEKLSEKEHSDLKNVRKKSSDYKYFPLMWYELVEEEHFLRMIDSEIPELRNIMINRINVDNHLNDANIIFEMQFYCDKEPEKWKKQNFNTVVINLRCCNVDNIKIMKTGFQLQSQETFFQGYSRN